jgi:hypothetical protein
MEDIQRALLICSMLDELAKEKGYKRGIQDLVNEKPERNKQLLEIVYKRLEEALKLKELMIKPLNNQ